jgi:uncharacterized protein YkwD
MGGGVISQEVATVLKHAVRPRRLSLAVLAASLVCGAAPAVAAASTTHHHAKAHHAAKKSSGVAANAASTAPCADATLMPTSQNLARITAATLCLVNQQRAAYGEVALRANAALTTAATKHSQDMVAHNYFDHTGPAGDTMQSRDKAAGYIKAGHGYAIGENIAAATGSLATPSQMVTSWMNSSGHRANILNASFRDSGIGVVASAPALLGSGPGGTYTQDFGVTS